MSGIRVIKPNFCRIFKSAVRAYNEAINSATEF